MRFSLYYEGDTLSLYAEIILNTEALEIDRPFTYKVPLKLEKEIKKGQIVKVPFGFGKKHSEGFVLSLREDDEVNITFKVKDIASIETIEPVITEKDIELIDFLRDQYLCRYIDAFRLLIPTGIMKGAKSKSKKVIVLINESLDNIKKDIFP